MSTAQVQYSGNGSAVVSIPSFTATYIRALFRSKSAPALMPLFQSSCDAAKEWTESFAAWHKLRAFLRPYTLAIHIGDGASCRTGALWAFHTGHRNVSIDPQYNERNIAKWQRGIGLTKIDRLEGIKALAEDVILPLVAEHIAAGGQPVLLTFVHAHVDVGALLSMLPIGSWRAAYTCACCEKDRQLIKHGHAFAAIEKEGDDWAILSPERAYQVLVPQNVKFAAAGVSDSAG